MPKMHLPCRQKHRHCTACQESGAVAVPILRHRKHVEDKLHSNDNAKMDANLRAGAASLSNYCARDPGKDLSSEKRGRMKTNARLRRRPTLALTEASALLPRVETEAARSATWFSLRGDFDYRRGQRLTHFLRPSVRVASARPPTPLTPPTRAAIKCASRVRSPILAAKHAGGAPPPQQQHEALLLHLGYVVQGQGARPSAGLRTDLVCSRDAAQLKQG